MTKTPVTLQKGAELDMLVARLITRAMMVLLLVFLFGVVQLFRHGNRADYLILVVGSVLSGLALFGYGFLTSKGPKSWARSLVAFGGLIPYLFGCYLVFYRGLWSLTALLNGFSWTLLVKPLGFVVLGYVVVVGIYRISEFVRKVDEGAIVLND